MGNILKLSDVEDVLEVDLSNRLASVIEKNRQDNSMVVDFDRLIEKELVVPHEIRKIIESNKELQTMTTWNSFKGLSPDCYELFGLLKNVERYRCRKACWDELFNSPDVDNQDIKYFKASKEYKEFIGKGLHKEKNPNRLHKRILDWVGGINWSFFIEGLLFSSALLCTMVFIYTVATSFIESASAPEPKLVVYNQILEVSNVSHRGVYVIKDGREVEIDVVSEGESFKIGDKVMCKIVYKENQYGSMMRNMIGDGIRLMYKIKENK